MKMWRVRFNDGSSIEVEASWIIEAIVEACTLSSHSYTDAVSSAHVAFEEFKNAA